MAAHSQQRHLKELLIEDQEPFHLSNYIAEKRSKLTDQQRKRPLRLKQQLQLKTQAATQPSFPAKFCKNSCFFSSFPGVDSPDHLITKSPLLLSPHKSPIKGRSSPNALFPHVPAKTAALLLEAALRIQNSSSKTPDSKPKYTTHIKNSGFGLFGSVIRRITQRNSTRKLETVGSATGDVVGWADSVKFDDGGSGRKSNASRRGEIARTRREFEMGLAENFDSVEDQTSFSNGRLSSVWSEENKSMELERSSSSSSNCCCSNSRDESDNEQDEEMRFVNSLERRKCNGDGDAEDFTFCSSPLSPFRFGLYKSPSSPDRRPTFGFSCPAKSPSQFKFEENVNSEQGSSVKSREKEEADEEDKEQNSPVCVLDPPFEDDEEEEFRGKDDKEFNLERSYASVQRAKQHILQKLRNFEKLAGLGPFELDYVELGCASQDENEDDDSASSGKLDREIDKVDGFLADMFTRSDFQELQKPGMKRLISDLISEEGSADFNDCELVVKRVCKKLESCEEIEPGSTIEMMVGLDLKREHNDWKNVKEEISGAATEVEILIFSVLVNEVVDELMLAA